MATRTSACEYAAGHLARHGRMQESVLQDKDFRAFKLLDTRIDSENQGGDEQVVGN